MSKKHVHFNQGRDLLCMLWKRNPLCTQRSALCVGLCVSLCAQACALGSCAGLVRQTWFCAFALSFCTRIASPARLKGILKGPLCAGLCAKGALCVLMKKLCFWLCAPFVRLPVWRPRRRRKSEACTYRSFRYSYSSTVIHYYSTVTH